MMLFQADYDQVEGSDREYGQGAIERNELPHREIRRNVWLFAAEQGDEESWARRLNEAVPDGAGSFCVKPAAESDAERVRRGEIELQQ